MMILYKPYIIPEKTKPIRDTEDLESRTSIASDLEVSTPISCPVKVPAKVVDRRQIAKPSIVPPTTVSRKGTIGSGTKRIMEDLTDWLPRASRKERVGIQKELRRLSYDKYFISHDYSKKYSGETRFCDLNGTLIGFVTPSLSEEGVQFDTTLVRNLGLTFEQSNSFHELIRVTAFLTEAGINGLRDYLDKKYLKRRAERLRGFEKRVYDFDFDGIIVHVNLRGKIDIYTESDVLEGNLVGSSDQLTHRERSNLRSYASFSAYKKWPRYTNNAINTVIGDEVNHLAIAVNEMAGRK